MSKFGGFYEPDLLADIYFGGSMKEKNKKITIFAVVIYTSNQFLGAFGQFRQ